MKHVYLNIIHELFPTMKFKIYKISQSQIHDFQTFSMKTFATEEGLIILRLLLLYMVLKKCMKWKVFQERELAKNSIQLHLGS
jgi:hypothetical protein